MDELFGLLALAGLAIGWILAGRKLYKEGRLPFFFGHLGTCAVLIFIYWAVIVYPVLNCSGFLCGLSEILLFVLLAGSTLLIWGLILLVLSGKGLTNQKEKLYTGKHKSVEQLPTEDEEF